MDQFAGSATALSDRDRLQRAVTGTDPGASDGLRGVAAAAGRDGCSARRADVPPPRTECRRITVAGDCSGPRQLSLPRSLALFAGGRNSSSNRAHLIDVRVSRYQEMLRCMGSPRPRRDGSWSSSLQLSSILVNVALLRGMVAAGGNIVNVTTIASGDGL
jgi:hypothetical protein